MRTLQKYKARLDALEERLESQKGSQDYSRYQDDPVGFGENVLAETFTPEIKALMESVRDNPVTIARSCNGPGKTHAAARIAVWFYKSFPGAQVYTAAAPPEGNLRKLLWGEIGSLVENHADVFKGDEVKALHIERRAQSFLTGVTIPTSGTETQREAKFSGKHAPNILFIVDEGDAVPDEVYKGIESCMSGGHARLLIMFNPRAQAGEVYRMERDGRAKVITLSAFSHPNVVQGKDIIPGAVTRETTVRRINEWTRPLAAGEPVDSECFRLPQFLKGTTAQAQDGSTYLPLKAGYYRIMEPAFSYMVLGRYPAQGSNQLISREWILRARERYEAHVREHGEIVPAHIQARAGLDVAEFGSDRNAIIFRYTNGLVQRPITWQGLDPYQTGHRAHTECQGRNISTLYADGCGIGAGVAPHVRALGLSAVSVRTFEGPKGRAEIGEFGTLRDELWWRCREWLRTDPTAMLPNDDQLFEELNTVTYEIKNGKIKVMDKPTMRELLRRSPDRADALCLTFYGGGVFEGCDLN